MQEPGNGVDPASRRRPAEVSTGDWQTGYAGFLVFVAIFYFAVVVPQLPEGSIRWIVGGAIAAVAAALWVAARLLKKPVRRSRVLAHVSAWLRAAGDLLIFAAFVGAIVLAAIYLANEDKVVLLKVSAIVYFSLLPALLYLQFSTGRTLAMWRDYVTNLYKLEIDDPVNLPRPPALSPFYPKWQQARDAAWKGGKRLEVLAPAKNEEDANKQLEHGNQYRVKFRDLFGDIPLLEKPRGVLSLGSSHKLQVVLATMLLALGWTFVVQPETVFDRSFAPEDFKLANLPVIPHETFAFAFLGAYFYILQMLVRRYFQNDLKATAYINATMRVVVVILLVWVIDPLLADRTSQATRSAVAFVIGVFPTVGWQFLQNILIRKPLGWAVRSLDPKHKLGDLDGLNIWYESRLLEVGIEDMQNLATTDIVDLMLNTRIPVDRIVDWIDQAFLYIRVVEEHQRDLLRGYGIRTATDLDDALSDEQVAKKLDRLLNVRWRRQGRNNWVIEYDGDKPRDDGLPSRIRALHATIKGERNLQHVVAWKRYTVRAQSKRPSMGRTPAPVAPTP